MLSHISCRQEEENFVGSYMEIYEGASTTNIINSISTPNPTDSCPELFLKIAIGEIIIFHFLLEWAENIFWRFSIIER